MEIEVNPEGVEKEVIKGLNTSYNGWGDKFLYDWSFKSHISGIKPDLIIFRENGKIVYGTGVFYRVAITSDGKRMKIAIIGNGYTLPDYRRRGYSTLGIRKAIEVAGTRGAIFLIGFVNKKNNSYRNMIANKCFEIDTSYLILHHENMMVGNGSTERLTKTFLTDPERIWESYCNSGEGSLRLEYQKDEFDHQYIRRSDEISMISYDDIDAYTILERKGDQNRIILMAGNHIDKFRAMIRDQIMDAKENGRDLFHFTSLPEERLVCQENGFEEIEGAITIFVSNGSLLRDIIDQKDDEPAEAYLERFLNEHQTWDIKNGDRM